MTVAKKPAKRKATKSEYELQQEEKLAVGWLDAEIKKAKDKPVSGLVTLTPALARVLMQRNPNNRTLSYPIIEKFARDISNGTWVVNGEPIIVSAEGMLNDGQHRCEAVILADKPINTILITGVERDTRTTLDQGRMRTIGDYLAMDGHSDTRALGSVATLVWQWQNTGVITRTMGKRPTKGELMALIERLPRIAECVSAVPAKNSNLVGGRVLLSFMRFAIISVAPKQEADAFIYALLNGDSLSVGSALLYARNRLMSGQRLNIGEKCELLFRAWNASRKDEAVKTIPLQGGELPLLEV